MNKRHEATLQTNSYFKDPSKDLVDSIFTAATYLDAWIKIKSLFGIYSILGKASLPYHNISQTGNLGSNMQGNVEETSETRVPPWSVHADNISFVSTKMCVARVICLSNHHQTTYLPSPAANILAETLR